MITKEQLHEIGRIKKLNRGQAEKDYLLDLILHSTTTNTKDELVFKGGTCLNKVYNMNRFSEDLDFTQTKKLDLKRLTETIIRDLKYFNIEATVEQKKVYDSVTTRFRVKGPLYTGDDKSTTTLRMDVNLKSTVILPPETIHLSSLYPEVPSTHVLVMNKKEILAEKIRALSTRSKPRDLYDIYYLLGKNVAIDKQLVEEKLGYYNEKLDVRKIEAAIEEVRNSWSREMKTLTRDPPEYHEVARLVSRKLKEDLSK